MQWYYAIDGQRLGPIPHPELERLVQAATIKDSTLLWRQGMDQWKTFAEVKERDPAMFTVAPPPLPETAPALFEDQTPAAVRKASNASADDQPMAPEGLVYAGFFRRAGAFLVDTLVWLFVWQILSNVVVLWAFPEMVKMTEAIAAAGGSMSYTPKPEEMVLLVKFTGVAMLVGLVWAIIYDVIFLSRFSATPGKLLFGLRVVRANGEPLGFMRIVARCLAKGLAGVPTLGIGFLISAFDEQKRGLHDFFCSTRVVKKP